jgi:hypothetical protein
LGWAEKQGLSRYWGSSLKGAAAIDWDDRAQRDQLLTEIVQDERRLLQVTEKVKEEHPERAEAIATDAALLRRLIAQDVEEKPGGGCEVKQGTAKDRVVSVPDAKMRHGRKSASQRFNGHKVAVAVEIDSQLISAVEVLPGNAGDQEKALNLVEHTARVMGAKVDETVGDCAYRGGSTRRAFAEAERPLTAKVPASHNAYAVVPRYVRRRRLQSRQAGPGHLRGDGARDAPGRRTSSRYPTLTSLDLLALWRIPQVLSWGSRPAPHGARF